MRCSIIITLFNKEKYIYDCVQSCLKQTYEDVKVVVVDDCSTDASLNRIWNMHDSRLKIIRHSKNKGYAKAKNTGIRATQDRFIAFLDADDMLTPESIEVRYKAFEEKPERQFVHGFAYSIYGDVGLDWCNAHRHELKRHGRHKDRVHAQGVMMRREVLEKYGLFYDMLSKSDKCMWYRLGVHPLSPLPKLVKAKKIDDFVAYYRIDPKSMKHSLDKKKKEELLKQFNKRINQLKKCGITHVNTEFI